MSGESHVRRACRAGVILASLALAACEAPSTDHVSSESAASGPRAQPSPEQEAEADAMPSISPRDVSIPEDGLPDPDDGHIEKSLTYRDIAGDHLLLLRRASRTSDTDDDVVEHVSLAASLYGVTPQGDAHAYPKHWQAGETVECEGLDFEADFLPDALRVEDFDGDGRAEILFGYRSFCGGGIEPHEITLILRAGEREYRLQGESLVQPPGDAPAFGGTYATTPAEADIPAPLRTALLDAWERVKHQSIE